MDQVRACVICHCLFDENIVLPLGVLHEDIQNSIKNDGIICPSDSYICRPDLSKYTTLLSNGCTEEECRMFSSPADIQTLCTFSDRCSDLLAASVGSWSFLLLFCAFFVFWITLNTYFFITKPVDPYPFVFLNLILSVVAAIQAPIILMSQNRQAECDRARETYDYAIDLKAEMEIRKLHDKIDIILKSYPPITPLTKES
jgi:uncharacterized membrane protein